MMSVLAASAIAAFAQEPTTPTPATPASTHEWHGKGWHKFGAWKSLAPEEREKLKAARKAVKDNPDVVQARTKMIEQVKAFRETRRTAMLKTDPTIAPILEKLEAAKKEKPQQ